MNPYEYDSNYPNSHRSHTPNHLSRNYEYDRGSALSSKNDYDAESMISSRRDAPRWDRRSSTTSNYDRPRDLPAPPSQYSRAGSPPARSYAYSSYQASEPPIGHLAARKPPHRPPFKGFTTALPGNDFGYDDAASSRTPYPTHAEPDRSYKGFTSSSLHEPSPYKDSRHRYAGYGSQHCAEDYPPEPDHDHDLRPLQRHYTPDNNSLSGRSQCYEANERPWDSSSSCCDNSGYPNDRSLSPRTFKKECQRAYTEAKAQRMRNLEEGLYGKCDWATFDSKYC